MAFIGGKHALGCLLISSGGYPLVGHGGTPKQVILREIAFWEYKNNK